MNTNAEQDFSPHGSSLDLGGMEDLLDRAHLEVSEQPQVAESKLVNNLLEQLCRVNELVRDTSERLIGANQRLNSLSTLVSVQAKQMEMYSYYQTQSAKVPSLENQVSILTAELELHRRPIWQKMMFWKH